uniref:Uncharacterized protein n=1 Tax=Anguilla anguilla TaxID=7936 RepID=A0A0E9RJU7_ANGAN
MQTDRSFVLQAKDLPFWMAQDVWNAPSTRHLCDWPPGRFFQYWTTVHGYPLRKPGFKFTFSKKLHFAGCDE